jgi:hypothetical protein
MRVGPYCVENLQFRERITHYRRQSCNGGGGEPPVTTGGSGAVFCSSLFSSSASRAVATGIAPAADGDTVVNPAATGRGAAVALNPATPNSGSSETNSSAEFPASP